MNKYAELKKKHQKELNKLPMKAAFGKEQFKKMMEEWGLTTNAEDISKIDMLVGGCYCLKKDTHLFEEHFQRTQKELKEFLKDDDNLKSAFQYEFSNHECGLTCQPQEALLALPFTYKEVMTNKRLYRVFKNAWREYIRDYNKINKNIRDIR